MNKQLTNPYLEDIENILIPLFEKHGYYFFRPNKQFKKEFSGGYATVTLFPQVSGSKYLVDIHLGVRVDKVEASIYEQLNYLPGSYNQSITASIPFGKLKPGKHPRIFASSNTELMEGLKGFHQYMEAEGFEFLKNLTQINYLEQKFNEIPKKPTILQYNNVLRSFRGVALAHLVGKPTHELANIYFEKFIAIYGSEQAQSRFRIFQAQLLKAN